MDLVPDNLLSSYRLLQDAAVDAVRRLKPFQPGQQDGESVPASFAVPLTFGIK